MVRGFVTFAAALLLAGSLGATEIAFDFNKTPEGKIPEKFSVWLSGNGAEPQWKVLNDDAPSALAPLTPKAGSSVKAAVIAQTSTDATDERFPALVYDGEVFTDFTFTTRFKLVAGSKERMAGVVFRAQDKDNYYVLRASGLGNTFRFYKFVNGQRSQPIGPEIQIPSGVWHTMAVQCEANKIRCFLNGQQAIPDLTDNSFNQGKIGFWTKSDSVSYFTDAKVTYTPKEIFAKKVITNLMEKYPRILAVKIYAPPLTGTNISLLYSTKEMAEEELKEDITVAGTAIHSDTPMLYQTKAIVKVTMPLHDRNGDPIAAIRLELNPFIGQTEQTSLTRAMVYKKEVESRIKNLKDLYE
jgi:hypothetical protein